ncbi:adhesion G- coupled receptor G2-like protein [Labeo rohita]|uniref:Adhesion G-coupled receptor G2-like protein n=1 Tax=Labeo rohita TaxID=84645 RepID=A0A498NSR3_LABRO|nr:adhesion G- coupled receptor G2-like protein [Labeo rohita]
MIVTKVVQARNIRATDGKRKTFRKQPMMVLSLFLLFGLTWSVMFFSYGAMIIPSYYIFTVLNSFQELFLFLYYYHIHNDVAGHFSKDPKAQIPTQPNEYFPGKCWHSVQQHHKSKDRKALDNLESKMEEMEKSNKTNEMIVTKDAVGLIYIQAKNTETKDINICYSSNHTMVVESQTDPNTNCSWSVKISKEAFDKSRLENNGSAFVGVLQFKNIGNKDETKNQTVLNNEVYGITMRANITNLTNNIDMFFTNNDMECKASCSSWDGKALVLHYSMLASFSWFFIQALHMYLWLIRQNVTITNYMRKITVLGWVCPAPIVIVIASVGGYKAVILNATSGKITRMCWITNSYIHYIVNIGYYALVFIFTTGIFIIIVTKVVQGRNIKAVDGKRKTFRKQLMMVLSLFLLFGLTWSVMFFSYGAMIIPSYYIFTVLNSFQDCGINDAVDPGERCRNATYKRSTCKEKGSGYILRLKDQPDQWKCVTCNKPNTPCSQGNKTACIKQPETNISLPEIIKDEDGFIDPAKASYGAMIIPSYYIFTVLNSFQDCGINDAVDPGERCRNATYKRSTCKEKGSGYILRLKDQPDQWKCVTCNKTNTPCSQGNKTACIKQPETNISLPEIIKDEDGFVDPAKASDALNNMTSLVKEMEKSNKLSAVIDMGDVIGVLQIQADNTETEDFCYSSDQNVMNILDCQSDLETDSPWSVKIPSEAFDKARLERNERAFVGVLRFKNMGNKSVANTQDNAACVFIALVLHYSMLASFTWFFIQALHMYLWLIRQNVTITNYMRKITVLGWVCPALIVVVIVSVGGYKAVILNAMSGKITQMCWISNPYILYTVNIGYYTLVFIFMTGIFITLLTRIVQVRIRRAIDGKRKTFRKQLMMVLSLFLLFEKRSGYILRLKDQPDQWKCVTCNKPNTPCSQGNKTACIKQPETNISLPEIIKDEDGFVDPAKASDALNNMTSLVKEMEKSNKLSAVIDMGDVIGVLQIQANNTETEDFCYSSDQNVMNILDCQSDLETDSPWSVKIPSEAFDKARLERNERAFVGVLRFKNMGNKVSEASCVSWDGKGRLNWTTFGCETEISNNSIKCSCSHLTTFAVLMHLPNVKITAPHQESPTSITSIGCGIFIFFMAIALFMHFLLQ